MATHCSILVWKIPWTEEPGGLQSKGLHRVRCDWAQRTHTHTHTHITNVDSSSEQLNHLMRSVDSGRGCACVGAGTILKLATQFCCGPKTAPKNNVYFKKKKKKEGHMLFKYSLQTRGGKIHGKRKIKESVAPYRQLIKTTRELKTSYWKHY